MEQHDAFEDLFQLYKSVLNSLKSVENNIDAGNQFSGKSLTEASGLFKEMWIPAFFISLFGLSKQLQGLTTKIVKDYEIVSSVIEHLNNITSNQVDKFEEIFKKFEKMENLSNVKLADPRAMQVQTIRCNTDYDSPEEYYIYDALLFRF